MPPLSDGLYENPMTFVRSCKGAPISVLVALSFIRGPATSFELQKWTGYKDDNITLATRLLVDMGWLVAITARGPWALAAGKQLPLGAFIEGESDLIGTLTATTTTEISSIAEKLSSSNKAGNRTPIKSESVVRENPLYDENIVACRGAGIGYPTRETLSDLPHVTPDLIRSHVKALVAGESIGLAILRIRENEAPREIIEAPAASHRYNVSDWLGEIGTDRGEVEIGCMELVLDEARLGERAANGQPYATGRCGKQVVPGSNRCADHQGE